MNCLFSFLLLPLATIAATPPAPVTLKWLGDAAPAAPAGVTWGVPWPKGGVTTNRAMRLVTAGGRRIEVLTWPLACWPDGSVKWTGHAIAATPGLDGTARLERPNSPAAPRPEQFGAFPKPEDRRPFTRFGLEWMCHALN